MASQEYETEDDLVEDEGDDDLELDELTAGDDVDAVQAADELGDDEAVRVDDADVPDVDVADVDVAGVDVADVESEDDADDVEVDDDSDADAVVDDTEDESLDVLLAREKAEDDDLVRLDDEPRDALNPTTTPIGANEFTCRSCFLVKRRAQLADADQMICFDCA
ncbi:hypothetical protein BH20ACT7_BH20ACT7_10370 [soil metagenome]